jgi:hypothetical protein
MEGQVKITVIATGFDRERVQASPAAQASKTTPVDMTAYAAVKVQPEERLVVNGSNGSRVVIARRPPVADLPVLPLGDAAEGAPADEDSSPLDVPAFLRRS